MNVRRAIDKKRERGREREKFKISREKKIGTMAPDE